jgi:hypothetical protein
MWFGHPGVLEGTMTRQPFLCPMDHVFEVIIQGAKIFFYNFTYTHIYSVWRHQLSFVHFVCFMLS